MIKMKTLVILMAMIWSGFVSAQLQSEDCVFTDSIDNFGWGWDPIAGTSCEPENPAATVDLFIAAFQAVDNTVTEDEIVEILRADFCDYSDADLHNGYGWNNVLLESCSPLASDQMTGGVDDPSMDVIEQPVAAPTIVSAFSIDEFPQNLLISSESVIYMHQPQSNSLVALRLDGGVLWRQELPRQLFFTDIQLTPDENLLIASSFGGQVAAYYLDGTMKWVVDLPNIPNSAPIISVGDTSIIAFFNPSNEFNESPVAPFIDSYDFEGTLQWRYESDLDIEGFTLGADGLVYVRLDESDDDDSKRYVVLNQQ